MRALGMQMGCLTSEVVGSSALGKAFEFLCSSLSAAAFLLLGCYCRGGSEATASH